MTEKIWDHINPVFEVEDHLWELFHENSKLSRYRAEPFPANEEVINWMKEIHGALPYAGYPTVPLPSERLPLQIPLADALSSRVTARRITPCALTLAQVGTLLYYGYGVTRENKQSIFVRPFRIVPSGGGLYPLEIYFHSAHIEGMPAGLYHYNPEQNMVQLLQEGDQTEQIADAMVFKHIANGAAITLFITAMFERSTYKYGDRGYRFTMIEAGHVAQNINLTAGALDLGCMLVGGFFDREMDRLLEIDGLTQSTVYVISLGKRLDKPEDFLLKQEGETEQQPLP